MELQMRSADGISQKYNLPIYTLQTLFKRTYVVCSPELVIAAQKDTKNLSFAPFVIAFAPRMFNVGKDDMDIISLNNDGRQGDWGLVPETHNGTYAALAPGQELDWMTRTMLDMMSTSLQALHDNIGKSSEGLEVNLYEWLRAEMSVASTEAVYGPENPFKREAGLVEAFWYAHLALLRCWLLLMRCTGTTKLA